MSECVKCGRQHPNGGNCGRKLKSNPENLRDRIAAAIFQTFKNQADAESERWPLTVEPAVGSDSFGGVAYVYGEVDIQAAANAVIAEMGLRRAEMGEWDVLAHGFRGYRYVTKWEADGE